MASALAQQLSQLKGLHAQERWTKGKHSLLFDYHKAADVSAETLLGIAQQGIESLCKVDKRYTPFIDSLFSRASLSVTRDQLTKDENEQLDTTLRAFLRVLVNHFLLPAAFQVLEYCVRRYQVHLYNVSELLLCALPYHSTPEFARLVALLQLKGSVWDWLTPCQQSGAPPPRDLLVRRCTNDQAVIREICKGAENLGVPGFVSKTYLSFYAVLLCEVFTAAPRVTEDLLTVLLPFLVAGLKSTATKDYRAATLMVLTQLLCKAQLGRDFVAAMVPEVIRSAPDLGDSTAIMLLTHMAASQPELRTLPVKSLQLLEELCQTGQQLADLQARGANVDAVLKLLLSSLAQSVPQHPQLQPLLLDLVHNVSLDAELVHSTVLQLLQNGAKVYQQQDAAAACQVPDHLPKALRAFDLQYPEQLDAAVNTALQLPSTAAAAADGAKHSTKHKRTQPVPDASCMFDFIQQCFSGSSHEVVAAGQQADPNVQQQQQALTLSLAVSAPASHMRTMALQKLDAICSQEANVPESTRQLLHRSLLTCLRDDVFAVAGAAAAAAGLSEVPAEQLLPALQQLLECAADRLASGKVVAGATASESNKEVLKAAKAALAAVAAVGERAAPAAEGPQQCSPMQQQAASILLEYVLADKRLKKLSKAAVQTCTTCKWHPLLQLLAAAPAVTAVLDEGAGGDETAAANLADSKRKRRKDASDSTVTQTEDDKHAGAVMLNRAVVQALADTLLGPSGAMQLLEITALAGICGPRCLHLLQLTLMKAASAAGDDAAPAVPATPSGKARSSRAKQQKQSTRSGHTSSQHGAASSAQIAVALVHMLEQQIMTPATSSKTSNTSKPVAGILGLHVPEQWLDTAASVLDDTALPTKQHYQQLHAHLLQSQTAVLLAALKAALTAAPASELSALLGQPAQLFARLAMAAAAAGQDSLQQHLQLLVAKVTQSEQQSVTFLADIYGLPPGLCSAEVQVAALHLLRLQGTSQPAASCSWFVQLLAAVNSSSKILRSAAVDTLLLIPTAQLMGKSQAEAVSELIGALQQQEQLLRGSGGALASLLRSAVSANSMDVAGSSRGRGTAKARGGKAAKAGAHEVGGDQEAAAEVHLSASCIEYVQQMLLSVLPELHQESQLQAAELAVSVLAAAGNVDVAEAAAGAQQLLQQLLHGLCSSAQPKPAAAHTSSLSQQLLVLQDDAAAVDAADQLQKLRTVVASGLLQFFTHESLASAAAGDAVTGFIDLLQLPYEAGSAATADAAGTRLSDAQLAAVAPVRAAALNQLDAALFAVLDAEQQQSVLSAALQTHAADGDSACRASARSALEQLPITADMLLQLLQRVAISRNEGGQPQQQQQSRAKRSKRAVVAAGASLHPESMDAEDPVAGSGIRRLSAADVDAATAALELLQWKDDVQHKEQLIQPLQLLINVCVPLMGTIAELHQEAEGDTSADTVQEPTDAKVHQPGGGAAAPSAVGYAAQLALLTLETLVKQHTASAAAVDPALVLSCASAAPDGAVRNAALLLLAVLAELSPEEVLGHVLQALTVIQQSAALQEDSHSQAVASAALSSLVPAWLSAGRGSEELWSSLIAALPKLPATRRLKLLESLLHALPQDSGLSVGLLLMMQCVVSSSAPAAGTAPVTAAPGSSKKARKGKHARTTDAAAAAEHDQPATDEAEWLPDLMSALCEKVSVPVRLQAFSDVLASSLKGPDRPLAAHEPLPRLAVTFVTANIQAKSVLAAAHADTSAAEVAENDLHTSEASLIQQACQSIMAQALQHLLQLNPTAAATQATTAPNKSSRKLHKAVRAAAAGVYELLAALELVQDAPSYLQAIVEMSRHPAESIQRRALKLLAARLMKVQVDLADLEAATEGLSGAYRQSKQQQLAQAGLAVCQDLPRLMQSQAPLTRQLALVAAEAGIRQLGSMLPSVVLQCLPVVLQTAEDTAAAGPVRVSAMACIASAVAAVGNKLVPLLPKTAAVVLAAAQAACQDLVHHDHALQQQGGDSSSDEDQDDEDETLAARSQGEQAALQLVAALLALEAMVDALGPFMSAYLKQIVQLLIHKQVLLCSTAGANDVAARLRAALPAKIPARLLLEPLVSQWEYAVAAGGSNKDVAVAGDAAPSAAPATALLDLVAALSASMDPGTAATYHEAVVSLILRALDTRQKWLSAAGGQQEQRAAAATDVEAEAAAVVSQFDHSAVHAVESAALKALSAIVMKLSESKFKPLFLRMIEWANAGSSSSSSSAVTADQQGRSATFMAVVCMLAHRLRGVFAPYFKYFAVMHMRLLAGDALAYEGKRPKKKHKKAAAAGPEFNAVLSAWLARLRAVRAVHLLALHEAAAAAPAAIQEQQERFDRLLPLVVEQFAEAPPGNVAAVLSVEGADVTLDLPGGPVAALGAAGAAAVEAGGSSVLLESCDLIGTAALGALLQIAAAGGSDVVWKPLHHAMLMASRGGSTRAKLLALGGVSRLADMLREEYLMLLPEALPFISELIEDGELAVEGAAQGLIAQLEALSGEKLEQYLKT